MLSKEVSSTIFKVFGLTGPGIEPRSPGPLANTLPTSPMSTDKLFVNKSYIFNTGKSSQYIKWSIERNPKSDCGFLCQSSWHIKNGIRIWFKVGWLVGRFCCIFNVQLQSFLYKHTFYLTLIIFTNPSARAGYDTRSIFKRSLTGLISEFFLLLD